MATMNSTFHSTYPVITLTSFSFPMTFIYFALVILACVSIGRVLYFRHKFLSFQGGFLSLSLVWSLLRAVMLLFTDLFANRAPLLYRLLLWIPEVFQLATFSLLVVFFGSILNEELRTVYLVGYGVLNGLFLVMHVVVYTLIVASHIYLPAMIEEVGDTVSFVALAGLTLFHGVRLYILLGDPVQGVPALAKLGRRSSRGKLGVFVAFVVTVLISRSVVELLMALNVVYFNNFGVRTGFSWEGGLWFAAYMVWEVIPITIFILSYWPTGASRATPEGLPFLHPKSAMMSVNSSMGDTISGKPISIAYKSEGDPLLSSNMFSDPARYDSDEEDSKFETVSGSMFSPYFTNSPNLRK